MSHVRCQLKESSGNACNNAAQRFKFHLNCGLFFIKNSKLSAPFSSHFSLSRDCEVTKHVATRWHVTTPSRDRRNELCPFCFFYRTATEKLNCFDFFYCWPLICYRHGLGDNLRKADISVVKGWRAGSSGNKRIKWPELMRVSGRVRIDWTDCITCCSATTTWHAMAAGLIRSIVVDRWWQQSHHELSTGGASCPASSKNNQSMYRKCMRW